MKDMNNDNINPFVGACPDSPNVSILMNYCQKGSLQVNIFCTDLHMKLSLVRFTIE